jgi:hypothetical protein
MRHGIDLKPIHNVKDARAIPRCSARTASSRIWFPSLETIRIADLVERIGIEPMTSSLQS